MTKSKLYVWAEDAVWQNSKGESHREDGPAYTDSKGYEGWYLNDQAHREDGPASVDSDGTEYWFLNGKEYTEKDYNDKIKTLR